MDVPSSVPRRAARPITLDAMLKASDALLHVAPGRLDRIP